MVLLLYANLCVLQYKIITYRLKSFPLGNVKNTLVTYHDSKDAEVIATLPEDGLFRVEETSTHELFGQR